MRAAAVVLCLVLTGCSLPLSRDVQTAGDVAGEQRPAGPLQVIPPGPKAGATPAEAVLGFLGAQASSEDDHRIARQFLTPAASSGWQADAEVQVYDPDRLVVAQVPGASATAAVVRVSLVVTGRVRVDGSFAVIPEVPITEDYGLRRVGSRWRLAEVPDGLRLTAADRQRSFGARSVYYLAPIVGQGQGHLVADQVFLPLGPDLAETLVARLLKPPSQALAGSVRTAVPRGAALRRLARSSTGVITVDLRGMAERPVGVPAQELSAQLVWTLRSLGGAFRGLRLLVDGVPLAVPDADEVQDAGSWDAFDPERLGPDPALYYTTDRRLRASVALPPNPASSGDVGEGSAVAVDVAVVTPDETRVALLEQARGGLVTVRIGPLRGQVFPVVASGRLSSPSWGSGEQGLWAVQARNEVVRVGQGGVRPVTVLGLPAGSLDAVAVARDGVRVALVVSGRLYVGRVEVVGGQPRMTGLTAILPGLQSVRQVVWESGTQLVVLGRLTRDSQLVRISVDGSSASVLNTAGLSPVAVAASPAGVVVLSAGRLHLATEGVFRRAFDRAAAPAYPG